MPQAWNGFRNRLVPNLIASESRNEISGKYSAGKIADVLAPHSVRRRVAAGTIALASMVWIAGLAALGYAQPALPWCITLAATAAGAILSSRGRINPYAPAIVLRADRQPVSFMEAFALTYMVASVALSAWIIYHLLYKPPPLPVKRQVVDIELTSLADYQNRHDPLPGSVEKNALRKRTASIITSHGSLAALPAPQNLAPHTEPNKTDGSDERKLQAPPDKSVLKSPQVSEAKMIVMQPLKSIDSPVFVTNQPVAHNPVNKRVIMLDSSARKQKQSDDRPFMEEVGPPEMVEMMDNDGENSLDVWQAGGHSAGGTGSKSDIVAYLKDVNRRIKSAWSPPRGEPWKTEILFRIAKSGRLMSARVIRSSGSAEADEAAMKALVASAPFKTLPADYPHSYLDLHYSFNYNVDQLTEINDALPR